MVILIFYMKITYYPTLPCEYHIARFPTFSRMEGSVWRKALCGYLKGTMTTFSPAEPSDADRERMSAKSSQSRPSESYRFEYLRLTGEDTRERRTINPR